MFTNKHCWMKKNLHIKRRKPRLELKETPPINSITDLIEIGRSIMYYKNINTIMLWRITPYLEELDNLIGMESLKESIFEQILYYVQGMHKRNSSDEYLHTVLTGPPGTGKTTVAKIIARIYQGLGILSKNGPFKIAHRDDFVAGYLGQTSLKTQKLLNSCLGGVLFIDEVYSLGSGQDDKDSFAKEAIDTIVSFLSEHTDDFCCIIAGYEKDIKKCFFSVNEGLESRFQWNHKINKYNSMDLAQIFIRKILKINWELSIELDDISSIIEKNKQLFMNSGRDVINFISKCKISHSKRVITLDIIHKFILTKVDLENGIEMLIKNSSIKEEKDDFLEPPDFMYI